MRILLVEDDPMIGESVADGLKSEGYAVDWVRDGKEAEVAASRNAVLAGGARPWICRDATASTC